VAFLPNSCALDLSRLQPQWSSAHVSQTDDGGRFTPAVPLEPPRVAIVHDAGYLVAGSDEIAGAPEVRLKPWGRLAGVVRLAGRPAEGVRALLTLVRNGGPEELCVSVRQESGLTGEDGRFAFERIPAGTYVVGLAVEGARGGVSSHRRRVEVKAGKTSRVTIGGSGRPVEGRLLARHVYTPAPHVTAWQVRIERARTASVQRSGPLGRLGRAVARWLRGPPKPGPSRPTLGRLYEYAAVAGPDGGFRIDDVPPGQYTLTVHVRGISTPAGAGSVPYEGELGTWSGGLEVPRGSRAEPVDLGEIPVRLAPRREPERIWD
jgi:hypothetical protein